MEGILSDRLDIADVLVSSGELSHRSNTWGLFLISLRQARQPGSDKVALSEFPRAKRNGGISLTSVFKNCRSRLAGYLITGDGHIVFSSPLAEQESVTSYLLAASRMLWGLIHVCCGFA